MLKMPSSVEKNASGVGIQISNKEEILFRSSEVGVQWSGRFGEDIAKEGRSVVAYGVVLWSAVYTYPAAVRCQVPLLKL